MTSPAQEAAREQTCSEPAAYRFTWPGHDESFVCEAHSRQLKGIAEAMGMHLQVVGVPITGTAEDEKCRQKLR